MGNRKHGYLDYRFFQISFQPGLYITVHVINVPTNRWNAFRSAQLTDNVILYGLLPHEHQMCVMNVVLQRIPDSEVPLKSKEQLIVQCGYRRFVVNPIYSQHTNGDKHKVRFQMIISLSVNHVILCFHSSNASSGLMKLYVQLSMPRFSFLQPLCLHSKWILTLLWLWSHVAACFLAIQIELF